MLSLIRSFLISISFIIEWKSSSSIDLFRCSLLYILLIHITLLNFSNTEKQKINKVLDNLHKYASEANGNKYFALFNDQAVFHGTDLNERWTIDEFKNYAQNRFDTGTGWTYKSLERNIFINSSNTTAWFDEILINEKYGKFRGTGV